MNKNLFRPSPNLVVPTDTTNNAGGAAYLLTPQETLASIACTGFFGDTFYVKAEDQLKAIVEAAGKCDDQFVAKVAVYARQSGLMRDAPAVLCAYLFGKRALPDAIFFRVINNMRMLSNFVACVRSGQFGRRSLGNAGKRLISMWLAKRSCHYLWSWSSSTSPSLADILRLARPRPETFDADMGRPLLDAERAAFYRYVVGKDVVLTKLPQVVQDTLAFFNDNTKPLPEDVQFLKLSGQKLLPEHWRQLIEGGGFEFVRRNLTTAQKHGVLKDERVLEMVVKKLSSPEEVQRARQLPFQLLTTLAAIHDDVEMPGAVKVAMFKALENSLSNVPELKGHVWIAVDVSSSMSGRPAPTSRTTYVEIASMFCAALARKNHDAKVVLFNTGAVYHTVNPLDSLATIAQGIARYVGGGTSCAAPLLLLDEDKRSVDTFIMISDNESWADRHNFYSTMSTGSVAAWNRIRQRCPKARQVRINISPNGTDQIPRQPDTLRVAGFSDAVFTAIASWLDSKDWVAQIEEVSL